MVGTGIEKLALMEYQVYEIQIQATGKKLSKTQSITS